jgi:adenylate kinase family enzyme
MRQVVLRTHSCYREKVQRIHIIGGSGSGKTMLARQVAASLGIPFYHLDEIYFGSDSYFKEEMETHRPLDARLDDVCYIAAQAAWVTEGNYLWWTEELLRRADIIIWLDLPWRVTAWRIIIRQVRKGLTNPTHYSIGHKLSRFMRFFLRQRKYYLSSILVEPNPHNDDSAKNRVTTAHYLVPYNDKLERCYSVSQAETFLANIGKMESL